MEDEEYEKRMAHPWRKEDAAEDFDCAPWYLRLYWWLVTRWWW